MKIIAEGFVLQNKPKIIVASIPGRWLLNHTTPSWRLEDPILGFQRMVDTKRANLIAKTVLDQGRTFPNAIVLTTNEEDLFIDNGNVNLPAYLKFLVVDGQHRLWAQHYSQNEANYACIIHLGLNEQEMATLFLEINKNQKRVPASLKWDLVRLIGSDEDPNISRAADLVYYLTTEYHSPLFQRIDLTGEVPSLTIKQGSIAPEIKGILNKPSVKNYGFDAQATLLTAFFEAVRNCDPEGWKQGTSPLLENRTLRVLIRLIPDILEVSETKIEAATAFTFSSYLERINLNSLDKEAIKGQQGGAGMNQILATIKQQIF